MLCQSGLICLILTFLVEYELHYCSMFCIIYETMTWVATTSLLSFKATFRLAVSFRVHLAVVVKPCSSFVGFICFCTFGSLRLPAAGTLKWYSKTLEYEYRVKTTALGTLKRYSIFFSHSIFRVVQCLPYSGQWRAPLAKQRKKCYNS
jgi:hypothetical protein